MKLKKGKEKPVKNRHPWVFSGALADEEKASDGEIVDLVDSKGRFLARGYYNSKSQIRLRLLTWDENRAIDRTFWKERIDNAIHSRSHLISDKTNAIRLIHGEADRLPGLFLDKFGDWFVLQAQTAGINSHLDIISDIIFEHKPVGLFERSDDNSRKLEGLEKVCRCLRGDEPPKNGVEISENAVKYLVNIQTGHKTGFYLDQSQNRAIIGKLGNNKRVLDCFCYTGGFSVAAAAAGAKSVLSIDSSRPALELLDQNLELNSLGDRDGDILREADIFEELRNLQDTGEKFDLIILDPPKFAHRSHDIPKASRAYKDINMIAMNLLSSGGTLATFSCSGHVSADLFQKIIFGASIDAGVEMQIVSPLSQAPDHPVLLSFPESRYLKGLLCRRISR